MRRWLQARKTRKNQGAGRNDDGRSDDAARNRSERGVFELLVLTGADAGQRFTLTGEETIIGRRLDSAEVRGGILLRDATVSARQAVIRAGKDGPTLEHHRNATNPTLVNGAAVRAARLKEGDHIEFGRVAIGVRSGADTSIRDVTELHTPALPLEHAHQTKRGFHTQVVEAPTREVEVSGILDTPALATDVGWLEVVESSDHPTGPARFALRAHRTSIGRGADTDVQVNDLGVSRHHAELVWEGRQLVLYHKSATNLTLVNRREVPNRLVVQQGDEIALAGRVTLRLDINPAFHAPKDTSVPAAASATGSTETPGSTGATAQDLGLRDAMERKGELERRIAEDSSVDGSFFDLDVVNSTGMKTDISEPERIVLSFERFRSYVAHVVQQHEGHVLNSNGDELMCFFASAKNALAAGHAVFAGLDDFNRDDNLLDIPFAFRVGIHSGRSLVDLKRGIAYSATLDVAGHLQKLAPTNRITISQHTRDALPDTSGLGWAGTLEREGFDYFLVEETVLAR